MLLLATRTATARQGFLECECRLLALSGHATRGEKCPLLGTKRTCRPPRLMSDFDPRNRLENFVGYLGVTVSKVHQISAFSAYFFSGTNSCLDIRKLFQRRALKGSET